MVSYEPKGFPNPRIRRRRHPFTMPSVTLAGSAALPLDGDLVRSYLRDIGRVPLLSHEQEITLGRQVQELMALEDLREELTIRAGGEVPADQIGRAHV